MYPQPLRHFRKAADSPAALSRYRTGSSQDGACTRSYPEPDPRSYHPALKRRPPFFQIRLSLHGIYHAVVVVHDRPVIVIPGHRNHADLTAQIKLVHPCCGLVPGSTFSADTDYNLQCISDTDGCQEEPCTTHPSESRSDLRGPPPQYQAHCSALDIPVRHDRVSRAGLIRSKKRLTAVNVHTVICLSSSTGRHQIIASVDLINMRSLSKQRVIHNGIEDDMFFPTGSGTFPDPVHRRRSASGTGTLSPPGSDCCSTTFSHHCQKTGTGQCHRLPQ